MSTAASRTGSSDASSRGRRFYGDDLPQAGLCAHRERLPSGPARRAPGPRRIVIGGRWTGSPVHRSTSSTHQRQRAGDGGRDLRTAPPGHRLRQRGRGPCGLNGRPGAALYVFSGTALPGPRLARTSRRRCVNDVVVHEVISASLRRRRDSGIGKYHGKAGFDTFTMSAASSGTVFSSTARFATHPTGTT